MGFRTNSFAKVWDVERVSDANTRLRISVSKKNKQTGEYEQDFSGFVNCIGTATANKAAALKQGSRIKLGEVDVTTKYDKEKNKEYINYKVFSFDLDDEVKDKTDGNDKQKKSKEKEEEDSRLPF